MIPRKVFRPAVFLLVAVLCAVACGQTKPQITLSAVHIPSKAHLEMRGSGFTPNKDVFSHLKRPDGSEFPVLPILTDARGEFVHDVDTLLLPVGTHELWVIDSTTGIISNTAKFDVTLDQ